jgi:hypothetical protein
MPDKHRKAARPDRDEPVSRPVRCKRDKWYIVRARLRPGAELRQAAFTVQFLKDGENVAQRGVRLYAVARPVQPVELIGWMKTAANATHVRLSAADSALEGKVAEVVLQVAPERDPKCHPWANVPRWSTYRPPFAIDRVVLPPALGALAELLDGMTVEVVPPPGSAAELARRARGAACVVDPQWATDVKLTLADLERAAASAWLVVDLATLARLVSRSGAGTMEVAEYRSGDGLMSARVEYADVPTRGFALQDVLPYATLDERGRFGARGLRATPAWRRHADAVGFATLLSAEMPWEAKHGDVLSAMRAVGGGELIATDLPWLVTDGNTPLLAPRVAAHLLRMHLAAPIKEHVQYWNRWDNADTVVRDIADLARRYTPLRAVRWASDDAGLVHIGITLVPTDATSGRHLIIATGRIDSCAIHDGVPPEPMMIFMKWLAREAREQTDWARQYLSGLMVTWQFDAADGLKYAANYDAADAATDRAPAVVRVRMGGEAGEGLVLADDEGLFGDGALEIQDVLTRHLRRAIERAAVCQRG